MSDNKKKRLRGRDRVHYICALVAALPFHVLFLYSIQIHGAIAVKTLLYLGINTALLFAMFFFMKFIYEEPDSKVILKKLVLYEVVPVLLFFLLFVQGNAVKVGRFDTLQEYGDTFMPTEEDE